MNKSFILILVILLKQNCFSADKSYKNAIFLHTETIKTAKSANSNLQFGLSFIHQLKPFFIQADLSKWYGSAYPNILYEGEDYPSGPSNNYYTPSYFWARENFKFIEIGFGKCFKIKKHELTTSVLFDYAWGTNIYMEISWNGFYDSKGVFHVWDSVFNTSFVQTHYFGYSGKLCYNYYFAHERMSAGVHAAFKYLFKYDKTQIDYGVQVGYNFNFIKNKKS